jgi:small-conductance mechanosensitive channel
MLERQLIEVNEYMQSLENDKIELNNQLDELRQQLESRDRQIQTFQVSIKGYTDSFSVMI